VVGVCVERSLEMVVGRLGILKAGGAHLPLDSSYPKERLAYILKDAQAPVLVTQTRLSEQLPDYDKEVMWDIIDHSPSTLSRAVITCSRHWQRLIAFKPVKRQPLSRL
jgi:non-ribosomal peptide synthetase component F